MIEIKKLPEETEEEFLWRVGQLIDSKQIKNWESITDVINKELLGDDETLYRTESAWRKKYQVAKKFMDNCFSKMESSEYIEELDSVKRELERKKIQYRDERNAWNKQNYTDARIEQKLDYLEDVLKNIGKKDFVCDKENLITSNNDNDLICCLSDLHIGQTFDSKFGEYNSDIAEKRLQKYFDEIVSIGKRHGSENVYLNLLGDQISGNIHLSIQVSNRENVIEQIKKSASLISSFALGLSKYFNHIYITSVVGNHSRIVTKKELDIKDERLDSLITWIIEQITLHCDNITVLNDNFDSGISCIDVRGNKYVGIHGDYDEMSSNSIGKLCMMLGFFPYAILCGHKHTSAYQEFNNIKCIQSGSLAGSGDDYCISKRLSGKPSQTVLVCNKDGIDAIYNVELNK